jgi:hypothetical protein
MTLRCTAAPSGAEASIGISRRSVLTVIDNHSGISDNRESLATMEYGALVLKAEAA